MLNAFLNSPLLFASVYMTLPWKILGLLFCQDGRSLHHVAGWFLRTLLILDCCFLEIMLQHQQLCLVCIYQDYVCVKLVTRDFVSLKKNYFLKTTQQ